MRRKFFMDDKTLMVEIRCDQSSVVTRPATDEEKADHEAAKKPAKKAKK